MKLKKRIMKKIGLLLIGIIAFQFIGRTQNVKDQRANFQYIQLPLQPLKGITTYHVTLDQTAIEKNNNDSLDVYNAKLMAMEAEYDYWLANKKSIDKAYLLEMAKYEKAVNAGNTAAPLPQKPPYPPQPSRDNLPLPILTQDVDQSFVENNISLEGFAKENNGVEIFIGLMAFKTASFEVKTKKSATQIEYTYSSKAKYPVRVKVIVPEKGVLLDQIVGNEIVTKKLKTYTSKYDFDYWKMDSLETFWNKRQKEILQVSLKKAYNLINSNFGFPVVNYSTEIYTVKKFKSYNYNDLVDAYTYVNSGYNLIKSSKDHSSAIPKIKQGVAIWEQALSESNLSDSKSRINKKVTALLYYNLAEAYMWMNDFDKAENYRIKAEQGGVLKYKTRAKRLESLMLNLKKRYLVNT